MSIDFQLNQFSSLFELSVAFNFIYVTLAKDFFSDIVLFFAEPFKNLYTNTKAYLANAFESTISSLNDENNEELKKQLSTHFDSIKNTFQESDLDDITADEKRLNKLMKPTYLLSGLYAVIVLLIGGISSKDATDKVFGLLFLLSIAVTIAMLYPVFLFFTNRSRENSHGKNLIFFLIFLTILLFYYCSPFYTEWLQHPNCTTFFALTVVFLPFVLQFITNSAIYLREWYELFSKKRHFNKILKKVNRRRRINNERELELKANQIMDRHFQR